MAKRRTPKRLFSHNLVNRLAQQISALEKIDVEGHLEALKLREAIAELKKEAKILKKVAPHIYGFVPKK